MFRTDDEKLIARAIQDELERYSEDEFKSDCLRYAAWVVQEKLPRASGMRFAEVAHKLGLSKNSALNRWTESKRPLEAFTLSRVNLVDPATLTVNHLIAEYRELPRVASLVREAQEKGYVPADYVARTPSRFTLGRGHMLFFYTRLTWVRRRYDALVAEMRARGYNPHYPSLDTKLEGLDAHWFNDWEPSPDEIAVSQARIDERLKHRMTYKHKPGTKAALASGHFKPRV